MSATFTALDFETANHRGESICQVGLVRYENGVVKRELARLVRPPQNWFNARFTDIHGIHSGLTRAAPDFATLWPEIESLITGQTVVAHNGPRFDFRVLRQTLAHYGLPVPTFEGVCTLRIYGRGLATLCVEHGIALDHHDALSDARACGALYLRSLRMTA